MKVADVMSQKIVTATPSTPYRELWEAILLRRIHCLPVADNHRKLIGIVSEKDLIKPLYPDYTQYIDNLMSTQEFESMEESIREIVDLVAKNIMTRRVLFTRSGTPIMRALSRMIVHGVRQLPVLDDENVIIGIVSKGDILKALFQRQLQVEESRQTLTVVRPEVKRTQPVRRVKRPVKPSKPKAKRRKTS